MSDNMFTCSQCRGTFECGDEDEATAEMEALWPGFTKAECAVLCDDCFNRFMGVSDQGGAK